MADVRKIFISYAWRDGATVARWLFDRFNATPGWSAWMDLNLHADSVFAHELQKRLDDADLVVVVVSPDVNRRETPSFVQKELLYATDPDVNKPVYAVRAHNCHLPLIIQGYTYTDFFPETTYDDAFAKLIAQIDKGVPPPARSRRERELEYLREVARQHSFWGKVYVDTAAEAKIAPKAEEAGVADADIFVFLSEVAAAVYGDKGHSHDEDDRAKVETFGALSEALGKFDRVAIVGDPGSGKTTTLKRFAYRLAEDAAHDETQPLPVFVPLGGFEGGLLDSYIEAQFGGLHIRDYLPDRLVVLLDGLNETAFENVKQVAAWLERNPKARVMLTCRKLDYVERKLELQRVDVLPLNMERVLAFMAAYSLSEKARETLFWGLAGERWSDLWGRWQEAKLNFHDFWNGEQITDKHLAYRHTSGDQDRMYNAMRSSDTYPGLLGLVRNPFLLTMTIAIYARENIVPQNRAQLFDGFVRQMWDKRGKPAALKRPPWIDEEVQRRALIRLAYQMQWEKRGTLVETAWARVVIADAAPGHNADHLLYLLASAGILDMSSTTVKFTHQLLQEYFAAFELAEDLKRGVRADKYFPPGREEAVTGWEETAILLAGLHADDATPVIVWLADLEPELTARCLLDSGARVNDATRADLTARWTPRLTRLSDSPTIRAQYGRALGASDLDTRKGIGLHPELLPDIDWVTIPDDGEWTYQDEQLAGLPPFQISRYPVTYAQFQTFVAAPDGFRDGRWWDGLADDEGRRHNQSAPGEQAFKYANHPRERVSWYDAIAFCRWLSYRMGGGYDLDDVGAWKVRLPTEREWEKAARGTDGWIYPYGNESDAAKGNTNTTGIGQTSAVGLFPDGASPYGVMDMSGNVWEWCLTEYEQSAPRLEEENLRSSEPRVVRGGSWGNSRG
ncbi:MAG: SUMF1/EgtB/PvdO family nonheme iron enzyme, partial [Anaerolineae bacterium]|nr:SUMF1/EgtB/PvdO family nonheme iron enzyme [Anaerolineae bacterium]